MSLVTFSSDQLNFFKFAAVVFDVYPVAIRATFVHMWNTQVASRLGFHNWDDSLLVRNQFLRGEGGKTKYVPTNKSYMEWDCTALIEATLFARSFAMPHGSGDTLHKLYVEPCRLPKGTFHPIVISLAGNQTQTYAIALDQLRLLRNALCHQISTEKIPEATFDLFIQLSKDAIAALGESIAKIEEIERLGENEFPTARRRQLEEVLKRALKHIDDNLDQIGSDVKILNTEVEDVKMKLGDIGPDVKDVKAVVTDITAKVDGVGSGVQAVRAGVSDLTTKADDTVSLVRDLQTEIRDMKAKGNEKDFEFIEFMSKNFEEVSKNFEEIKREINGKSFRAASTIIQNPEAQSTSTEAQCTSAAFHNQGCIHYHKGNYNQAVEAFQVASNLRLSDPDGETKDTARSLNNLGAAQILTGDFYGALESLQNALRFASRHSSDDRETAAILNNLGCVYLKKDEDKKFQRTAPGVGYYQVSDHQPKTCEHNNRNRAIEKALEFLREATNMYTRLNSSLSEGCLDAQTASAFYNFGCVHFKLQNNASALEAFQFAANIRSDLLGDHEDTACTYLRLGIVQFHIGVDLDDALKSLHESSRLYQKLEGNPEPTATSFSYLGKVYVEMGDYKSALPAALKATDLNVKRLGDRHEHTAYSYHDLGVVYLHMGDLSKALEYFQKASSLNDAILGEHVHTATSFSFLGWVYMKMEDNEPAVEAFWRAANMRLTLLGSDKLTAYSFYSLGMAQRQLGDLSEAAKSLQTAAGMRSKLPNGFDKETSRYFHFLGLVQLDMKNWNGALESCQKAADMRLDLLGDHEDTACSYHNLGEVQANTSDNKGALLSLKKAAKIKAKLHDESEKAACTYNNLGIVQFRMGDLKGAVESLRKASRLNAELLKNHPSTAFTFHQLGFVLLERGDNESALQAFKKVAHIRSHLPGVPAKHKALSYHKLGVAQLRIGDLRGALKSLQEAADISSDPELVDPINAAFNCFRLGIVQLDMGINEKALEDESKLNANVRSYYELGKVQLRKGDLRGALESLNKAIRIREKLLEKYHADTTESQFLISEREKLLEKYHPHTTESLRLITQIDCERRTNEPRRELQRGKRIRRRLLRFLPWSQRDNS